MKGASAKIRNLTYRNFSNLRPAKAKYEREEPDLGVQNEEVVYTQKTNNFNRM